MKKHEMGFSKSLLLNSSSFGSLLPLWAKRLAPGSPFVSRNRLGLYKYVGDSLL